MFYKSSSQTSGIPRQKGQIIWMQTLAKLVEEIKKKKKTEYPNIILKKFSLKFKTFLF